MKRMTSLVGKGFQPAKCKTQLRLGSSRIKLLRNKKGIQIASDRREVAEFLRNGQDSNARLRVEHVIREQNLIEAYDLLYLYAERIAAQLSVIDSQKTCPSELKEDVSTLLYASSRCSELPDFAQIRPMFIAKYGKEFVSAAEELRPGCGVNGRVVEKLSVVRPSGEAKLQVMKDIAAEHDVEWDPAPFEKEIRAVQEDLLDGPSKIMLAETIDDFPAVPSQKPTLGTHVAQPDNFTNSNSGRVMEDKVEPPTNSPRPGDDFRTGSQGARSGPPARKPPGREQPRTEDLSFDDGHADMDPGRSETQPRRSSRRESDSFSALASQTRHQDEESRRNSIGVPRERSGRPHTGPAFGGIDESPPQDYTRHNWRESQGTEVDDFDQSSHRSGRRQSQKYDKYDGKGQVREADAEPSSHTKNSRPELNHTSDENEQGGFAKPRLGTDGGRRKQTRQDEEEDYSTVSRKEGSGKAKPRKQDLDLDEDYYKRVPSREGSGKARGQHQQETSVEEGSYRRISGKEGSQQYRRRDYSDEDADHTPHWNEEPRRRDSTKNTPKYVDEDVHNPVWDSEVFRNSVTTRTPRNSEDVYRDSGKGTRRESLNRRAGVSPQDDYSAHVAEGDDDVKKKKETYLDDASRKSNNLAGRKNEKSIYNTPHSESSEYEDDPRGGGSRKPESRHRGSNTRHSDRSSESGEEGSRQSTRRTPRLPSVDERRRDTLDDLESSRGRRHGREEPDSVRNPRFDNDHVNFDDDNFTASSRTEKRMSLPGGSVRDKSKYPGSRASDDYDDTVRRRATIGPEEIRTARVRETEDPPRSRYGEKEKQSDRKQSAPLPKDDIMVPDYSSQRDRSDRRRRSEIPAGFDDDRPRFSNPKVGLQGSPDDEYSPNTRTQRDRSDRPRKSDISPRFDDDQPPPRFIKVGKQTILDDEDLPSGGRSSPGLRGEKPQRFVNSPRRSDETLLPTPRLRSNLQTVKTDPDLPKTPKASAPEHRKSQSASDGQPQSKPAFMKPPDLDVLIQMFGNKGKKK